MLRSDDLPTCRAVYQLNEPGRFPSGFLPELEKTIASPTYHFVVACIENTVVGFGGISVQPGATAQAAWLAYGMVHPDWQRQGIGSALLLGRLCMLSLPDPYWRLTLSPVQKSWSYYARFGFAFCGRTETAGYHSHVYDALLYREHWIECREILENAGVTGTQDLIDARIAASVRE